MNLDDIQKPFIWRKKYEEQGVEIDEKKIEEECRRRAEANKAELAKIKERQQRREQEYRQKLLDNEALQRQKEAEQHEHWEQQEDDFVLRQSRQKSKIRIRDGRAKPIDLFAHYIDIFGVKIDDSGQVKGYLKEEKIDLSESPIELLNPSEWFNGLRLADLEELEPGILDYMNADFVDNRQYWQDLLDITRNEIAKLQAAEKPESGSDINPAVLNDLKSLWDGKSVEELEEMEQEIETMLQDDDPTIDEGFYRSSLMRLKAHRAKTRLTVKHEENLKHSDRKRVTVEQDRSKQVEQSDTVEMDVDKNETCIDDYKRNCYSPDKISQLEPGIEAKNYEEEFILLKYQRIKACNNPTPADDADISTEMDANEAPFSCEVPDNRNKTYIWADKYQPRKPRYFNRVHTGFEWNKYNQTHYDIDNPPPKVVQGYKFNIFYPDLIDKSKAPRFTITPCDDDKDFCTIRFIAGPPYEDLAFRIVNREWNNTHKSGYRCQFINNMLQLWFQFKRCKYRR
uniref:Splicing factor Cactin n=1 Tax=Aceria tosichella TaxID=561515 RepID=A0A6G1SIG3_9ACAR